MRVGDDDGMEEEVQEMDELEDMIGWEEEVVMAQVQAQDQIDVRVEALTRNGIVEGGGGGMRNGYGSEGEDFDVLFLEAVETWEWEQGMDIS